MNREITVKTESGFYPVRIGSGLMESFFKNDLLSINFDRIFFVIDENVYKLHQDQIEFILKKLDKPFFIYILPEGEKSKSFAEWKKILDFLLKNEVKRNSLLIAIGGGVTGDVAGFAAASILRGISLIHIPTTLLAMVDSAIGGKTGINHKTGKNLIGAFYQPKAVIEDINFLSTLPSTEWINGLSEILKYAAIRNDEIFSDVEFFLHPGKSFIKHPGLASLIEKCVRVKADIVAKDELENGIRAFLNFGHTFAHALEKEAGYKIISHGEAVFAGMLAALYFSNKTGADLDLIRLERFAPLYDLDKSINSFTASRLIQNMSADKKRIDSDIRLVLLRKWQNPYLFETDNKLLLSEAWNYSFHVLNSAGNSY
ncbi:MAG: 3-dehydroquinate synthase [Balneolaceae bacterium]